jgi:type II secretory pathway pseudopilin PulG
MNLKLLSKSGFSLVELLITVATVSALSGIGIAVYAQYQERAYNSNALQQGVQLRTAFEAGLSDRGSLGSTVFANNPALEFSIDGTLSCVSSCDDITPNQLFPGFVSTPGTRIFFNLFDSTQSYQIQSGHCRALTSDEANYDGWLVSDRQSSARVAIPIDPDEVSQCANVLAGGEFTTSAPTPSGTETPCGGYGSLCSGWTSAHNYCTSVWGGSSCVDDCSSCPPEPVCGDTVCEGDELNGGGMGCPADCISPTPTATPSSCIPSNGICEESCQGADCWSGDCATTCGNGICENTVCAIEDAGNCPADCGI